MPQLPVLDQCVLDDLGDELSSRDAAMRFAAIFADMLPQRIHDVEAAVRAGDRDAAVVALLNLNASATMVGARRLEEASSRALDVMGGPSMSGLPTLATRLHTLGLEFQSALGGIIR